MLLVIGVSVAEIALSRNSQTGHPGLPSESLACLMVIEHEHRNDTCETNAVIHGPLHVPL